MNSLLLRLSLKNVAHYENIFLPVFKRTFSVTQVTNIYSASALGIDGYLHNRKRTKEQFSNHFEKFKTKMQEFVADPKSMIFTEDLRNMVYLADVEHLDLVTNMIKKFNTQSTEYRFGSFIFGPVVMRLFHFLDAPNEALQSFEDAANEGFFDQLVSYQILMDLLYNHQRYDELYRVFDKVQKRQLNMIKYPKYIAIIVFAACYKQNTQQSMEYASKLWTEMTKSGAVPLRRATAFFAALALKQGAPHIALEAISNQKQHYVTIRNIKAMALAEIGRLEDALPVLRSVLEIDAPEQQGKHTFFKDTVNVVRCAVEKCNNSDLQREFENVEKALKDLNLVDDQTLDNLLNSEIGMAQSAPNQFNRGMLQPKRQQMPGQQRSYIP